MRDEVMLAGVVLTFASWVTAHLAIAVGLARRAPRWRALVALVVAPLAAYWAWRESMRWRAAAWVASALGYAVFRALAWK